MARALTRTNFHSSRLLRVLADLCVIDTVESSTGFAEKLGQWLNLNDAITLHGALNAGPAGIPAAPVGTKSFARGSIGDEFTRIRTTLENSIRKTTLPTPRSAVKGFPSAFIDEPMDISTAYEPHRRCYLSYQRDMDMSVSKLRANVRDALSRASPTHKKLASLDSALDGMLGVHESKLLSTVPSLLEKRFGQLFIAHQQTLVENKQTDNPSSWMHGGGWLAHFRKDMESALLAELDLRLQPTVGLMEALNNEKSNHK
jgi:hypothetical protein